MCQWFRKIWYNIQKDKIGNYHKQHCQLVGSRFTVIENKYAKKIYNCHVKYCPCCGEKLKGE